MAVSFPFRYVFANVPFIILPEQVKDKEELEGLSRKLAIREARLDRIIDLNGGSAEKGLYFTIVNAQSQGEVNI